jgi:hypothetical protein
MYACRNKGPGAAGSAFRAVGNPTRNSKKLSKAAWILRLAFIVRFAFSSLERSFLRVRGQWG